MPVVASCVSRSISLTALELLLEGVVAETVEGAGDVSVVSVGVVVIVVVVVVAGAAAISASVSGPASECI